MSGGISTAHEAYIRRLCDEMAEGLRVSSATALSLLTDALAMVDQARRDAETVREQLGGSLRREVGAQRELAAASARLSTAVAEEWEACAQIAEGYAGQTSQAATLIRARYWAVEPSLVPR